MSNDIQTKGTAQSETPKITSTSKPKDPRRVEAGKRLATISRSAKDKKARDRADWGETPQRKAQGKGVEPRTSASESESEGWPIAIDWTIPVGGLIVTGLVGLYYAYTKKPVSEDWLSVVTEPKKLDSFDD